MIYHFLMYFPFVVMTALWMDAFWTVFFLVYLFPLLSVLVCLNFDYGSFFLLERAITHTPFSLLPSTFNSMCSTYPLQPHIDSFQL
jgi:hypothetical protein